MNNVWECITSYDFSAVSMRMRGDFEMRQGNAKISVFYDGACPQCVKDRRNYEKLLGSLKEDVQWIDITGKDDFLRSIGIDPRKALTKLHVKDENGQILSEIDAYALLMQKVPVLRPLAAVIKLPLIRSGLSKVYHKRVSQRLRRSGRL
jgi:predicted DCC family thiol-disulfide oxidoreductase YuxK